MQTISRVIKVMGVVLCLSMATPVLSDPAPVYDADTMQQDDNDNIGSTDQDLPPQSAQSAQSQEGAFVPNQVPVPAPSASLSVEQRVQRVEQQVNNMQNNDLATRVESLQDQVQTLRGQVEQLTHQLQQALNQQKNMYSDLDKRLAQQTQQTASLPSKPAAASDEVAANAADDVQVTVPAPAAKPSRKSISTKSKVTIQTASADQVQPVAKQLTDGQPNVAEEQQIYQTAYNLIKAKKYSDAVTALQSMLKKYPSGQFASNAHYWLGELYGLMGKNDQALNEFSAVVKTFPDSPRVSDAQLKVGLIYASQTKWTDAKSAFRKVINQYPGTASARLASEQLKQIKLAGH